MFHLRQTVIATIFLAVALLAGSSSGQEEKEKPLPPAAGETPTELPRIPLPDAKAAALPPGFVAEPVITGLIYPTSIEFDDQGAILIAESGYAYGDDAAPARVLRIRVGDDQRPMTEVLADDLNGPVTDILWHGGSLYISHRGKISVLEGPHRLRDVVSGLPSLGDHHNNGMTVGPDGKIYFGQGVATNSGVVGIDNFQFGWLQKHPGFHDIPARDIVVRPEAFETVDPIAMLTSSRANEARTLPFQPFGMYKGTEPGPRSNSNAPDEQLEGMVVVKGQVKANGTILRMNSDGSELEIYAWGLRNPFGLGFTPDGKLLCTDAGYDERGSRPIANAPDCLWAIKPDGWYGFPDFVAGVPVTDPRFRSERGPALQFVMAEHPPVETPLLTLPPHTGGAKFDLSRSPAFGEGVAYVGLIGDMLPATGQPSQHPGFGVARLDLATLQTEQFFRTLPEALGPPGFEYVATAGPKRPIDVKFSPDGNALYVVDFGAMAVIPTAIGPAPRPFPGTGVLWRIVAARQP